MTQLVELRDLTVCAGDRMLVEGIDVDVYAGKVTALVGASGSGKSLTARSIMCVLDVDPGLVRGRLRLPAHDPTKDWYDGVCGSGVRAQQELLTRTQRLRGGYFSYSPQAASSALNPGRTIGRQMELAIGRRETEQNLSDISVLLREVGLKPEASRALPGELSGGMCQRAALAIALASRPKLVIADEPETGLDPVLRRAVIELMVSVCKRRDAGLLLISHHVSTVERIADTVVRLSDPEDMS